MTKEKKIMEVIKKFLDKQTSFYGATGISRNYTLAVAALDKIAKIISEE